MQLSTKIFFFRTEECHGKKLVVFDSVCPIYHVLPNNSLNFLTSHLHKNFRLKNLLLMDKKIISEIESVQYLMILTDRVKKCLLKS